MFRNYFSSNKIIANTVQFNYTNVVVFEATITENICMHLNRR